MQRADLFEQFAHAVAHDGMPRIAGIRHATHLVYILVMFKSESKTACITFPMAACNYHHITETTDSLFSLCTALLQQYFNALLSDADVTTKARQDLAARALTITAMFPHVEAPADWEHVPPSMMAAFRTLYKDSAEFKAVQRKMSKNLENILTNDGAGHESSVITNAAGFVANIISPNRGDSNDAMNPKVERAKVFFRAVIDGHARGETMTDLFKADNGKMNTFKLFAHPEDAARLASLDNDEKHKSHVRRIVHHINKWMENVHWAPCMQTSSRAKAIESFNGSLTNHVLAYGDAPDTERERHEKLPLVEFDLPAGCEEPGTLGDGEDMLDRMTTFLQWAALKDTTPKSPPPMAKKSPRVQHDDDDDVVDVDEPGPVDDEGAEDAPTVDQQLCCISELHEKHAEELAALQREEFAALGRMCKAIDDARNAFGETKGRIEARRVALTAAYPAAVASLRMTVSDAIVKRIETTKEEAHAEGYDKRKADEVDELTEMLEHKRARLAANY